MEELALRVRALVKHVTIRRYYFEKFSAKLRGISSYAAPPDKAREGNTVPESRIRPERMQRLAKAAISHSRIQSGAKQACEPIQKSQISRTKTINKKIVTV